LIKNVINKADFAYWFSIIINFGSALIVIPVAYIFLKDEELALWFSLSLLVSISFFSDFGASQSLLRLNQFPRSGWNKIPSYGSQIEKKKNNQNLRNTDLEKKLVNTSFLEALQFNIFFVIVGLLICVYISDARIQLSITNEIFKFVCLIYLLNIPIQNLTIFFSHLIQSKDQVFDAKIIDMSIGAIRIIFQASSLIFINDFLLFCFAHLLGSIIGLFFYTFICIKNRYINFNLKNLLLGHNLNSYNQFKIRIGAMTFGSFLILNSGPIIISNYSDPKLVSAFFLSTKIFLVLKTICQVPILSVVPKFGNFRANNELNKLVYLFSKRSRLSISLFILSFISLLFFSKNISLFGLESDLIIPFNLLFIMGVIYLLELNHGNHAQLYLSKNHQPFLIPSIISGFLILLLSLPAANFYGILGLLIVQGFIQLSFNNWYPIYLNIKDLKTSKIF
tara:strand:+ start:13251 stop:14600 length:1350 start_codon:yes stop_codon:yes gene_type:complete